jgi:hypothetical protein
MKFPDIDDFRSTFGVDPLAFDRDTLTFWYAFKSSEEGVEAIVSFSVLMRSFQVSMVLAEREIAMVSSEGVERIRLVEEKDEKKILVSFLESKCSSGVTLVLEPHLHLRWHTVSD